MPPPAGSQVSRVPAQRAPYDPVGAPVPLPPPAPRPRRLGRALGIVAAVVALFCLAGSITAYVLYDRATAPDRGTPDVAVYNYLRAFLVDGNDVRASEFVCSGSATGLTELTSFRADLRDREQRFGTPLQVSWGAMDVRQAEGSAQVGVELKVSAHVDGVTQRGRESWQFEVRDEPDGWRVCQARRLG